MSTGVDTMTKVRRDLRASEKALRDRLRLLRRDLDQGRDGALTAARAAIEESQRPARDRIEELENSLMLLRMNIDALERMEAAPAI